MPARNVEAEYASVRPQLGGVFLPTWMRFCLSQTDAPVNYHVLTGMAAMATVLPQRPVGIRIRWQIADTISPSVFVLLVGPSATARKSTCLRILHSAVKRVCKVRLTESVQSRGALADAIADSIDGVILSIETEWATFLPDASKTRHLGPLKGGLMKAYDGDDLSDRGRKKGRTRAEDYRFCYCAACAQSILFEHTEAADATGGFLNRFHVMDCPPDHVESEDMPEQTAESKALWDAVIKRLRQLHYNAPEGEYVLDPQATEVFKKWQKAVQSRSRAAAEDRGGIYSRALTYTLKYAALFAVDRLVPLDAPAVPPAPTKSETVVIDPFADNTASLIPASPALTTPPTEEPEARTIYITAEDLIPAIQIMWNGIGAAERITDKLAFSQVERNKLAVLDAIPYEPAKSVHIGQITDKVSKLLKPDAAKYLETLVSEGKVFQSNVNNMVTYYRLRKPE